MKNEKTNLIIWAVVALVIGVIIGTFLIAPATTGNAKAALKADSLKPSNGVALYSVDESGVVESYLISSSGSTLPVEKAQKKMYDSLQSACCSRGRNENPNHTVTWNPDGTGTVNNPCEGSCAPVQK